MVLFENFTCRRFFCPLSQIFLFLTCDGFSSWNSKSLSLLIFIIWARISYSWLILAASAGQLFIEFFHIFNLFVFIFLFFLFNRGINISHTFRFAPSFFSSNKWLRRLSLACASAICVFLSHKSVLNVSDIKREVATHWWILPETSAHVHKEHRYKWCNNNITKWLSQDIQITFCDGVIVLVIHFDVWLLSIIFSDSLFVHLFFNQN